MEKHNINPVFDDNSNILILGSFPSVKSRESRFFYGHPSNRFWRVISAVFGCECPADIPAKREMLLKNGIAVWDVIASCDIVGSGDSTIKNVVPNDLTRITEAGNIKRIFCNGALAFKLYERYCMADVGIRADRLPSTSPANAAFSLERLIEEWRIVRL